MSQNKSANDLPSGTDIHIPWHLRFPTSLESTFRNYLIDGMVKVAPWSFGAVVFLIVSALISEAIVVPDQMSITWRMRFLMLVAAGLFLYVSRTPQWRNWLPAATLVLAFTSAFSGIYLGIAIDHTLHYAFFLQVPMSIVLISSLLRMPFQHALLASLVMLATLSTAIFASAGAEKTLILSLISIGFALISLSGQYLHERLLRHHFLAENVLNQHRNELHSANKVLASQATVDAMTGCINRRGMEMRMASQFHQRRAAGSTAQRIVTLLFDIDFFKQYNDTYGHPEGDTCLKRVANVPLSMVQGDQDFVCRYGGEEFLVVLNGCSMDDAKLFAERMRQRIEQMGIPHSTSRVSNVVTISVGIASTDGGATDSSTLIQQADDALYAAKENGRNTVMVTAMDGAIHSAQ